MGEEVKMSEYEGGVNGGDEERVLEWETGLPSVDDLTPLSQPLIPPELASAFSISLAQYRTVHDVNQASEETLSSLRGITHSSNNFKSFGESHESAVLEADENDRDGSGSDSRKSQKIMDNAEEADSALPEADNSADDPSARTLKRPRLVWTSQLHKRFVDVVAHLGIKNAVPKTIMQLMNVEGLTRENVASHLQKYRLYLKRMQGLSTEGPSASDQLFSSTPVPQSLRESSSASGHSNGHNHGNGHFQVPVPIPYPPVMPVQVLGMTHHGHGHMGMPVGAPPNGAVGYHHGFESHHHHHHHPYNMLQQHQRDWSGNKYGSVVTYPHMATSDK